MRTIKQAAATTGISEKLIRSTIRQIGDREKLADVCSWGADAGFSGFTYYSNTISFFKRNRSEIIDLVKSLSADLDMGSPLDLVAGFRFFNGADKREIEPSVARVLYGGRITDDDTLVCNALAWFALEEVARAMCDE